MRQNLRRIPPCRPRPAPPPLKIWAVSPMMLIDVPLQPDDDEGSGFLASFRGAADLQLSPAAGGRTEVTDLINFWQYPQDEVLL